MLSTLLLAHRRWWEYNARKHNQDDSDEAYERYVEGLGVLLFINDLSMFEEDEK